jgi:hypothetical protein
MAYSLDRKVDCIRRELKMRRSVYPRWVDSGRLTQIQADEEIAVMAEILADLEKAAAANPGASGRLF